MNDLIFITGQDPINLALIETMSMEKNHVTFFFASGNYRWSFENSKQAKVVYLAILNSKCKNIGETELTAEEILEIENGL